MTIVGAILAASGDPRNRKIKTTFFPGFLAAAFSHHIALLYFFFGIIAGKTV